MNKRMKKTIIKREGIGICPRCGGTLDKKVDIEMGDETVYDACRRCAYYQLESYTINGGT